MTRSLLRSTVLPFAAAAVLITPLAVLARFTVVALAMATSSASTLKLAWACAAPAVLM